MAILFTWMFIFITNLAVFAPSSALRPFNSAPYNFFQDYYNSPNFSASKFADPSASVNLSAPNADTNYMSVSSASFKDEFHITWGEDIVNVLDDGQELQLALNNFTGSAFASTKRFFFGSIDMEMKLVPGNSAGTVTAYYLSSDHPTNHDELDFEFLGNLSGNPYILQTNVFTNGTGGREQRIYLWFDPSADFHTYSIIWNSQHVVFYVDGIPIREFANNEASGFPYLNKQGMGLFSSIWNGDSWATEGGSVKIDWTQAPFIASYRNYTFDACKWTGSPSLDCMNGKWWNDDSFLELSSDQQDKLEWVQQKYMVYDYCTDQKRNPEPPIECKNNQP